MTRLGWRRFGAAAVGICLATGGLSVFASASANAASTNLALGKPVTASTSYSGLALSNATDGNRKTQTACTDSSGTGAGAWCQLDLGASVALANVDVVSGDRDTAPSWVSQQWTSIMADWDLSLGDYYVLVSNSPLDANATPQKLAAQPGVWSSHQQDYALGVHDNNVAIPANVTGRYVMIKRDNADWPEGTILTQFLLSEIEVTAPATTPPSTTNLALHRPASQSSTYPWKAFSPTAALAVDGNTDGNFNDRSVTHTTGKGADWWQVDLGAADTIDSINVYNRTDCCSTRLSNYWVFVSNTPFNTALSPAKQATQPGVWASHRTTTPQPKASIPVGTTGRYVMIQENSTQYLSLAEVQVMGRAAPAANLALGKKVTTAAPLGNFQTQEVPAVTDGNRQTQGGCYETWITAAWCQVDLGASAALHNVDVVSEAGGPGNYVVLVSNSPIFDGANASGQTDIGKPMPGVWVSPVQNDTVSTLHDHNVAIPAGVTGRYVAIRQNFTEGSFKLSELIIN